MCVDKIQLTRSWNFELIFFTYDSIFFSQTHKKIATSSFCPFLGAHTLTHTHAQRQTHTHKKSLFISPKSAVNQTQKLFPSSPFSLTHSLSLVGSSPSPYEFYIKALLLSQKL